MGALVPGLETAASPGAVAAAARAASAELTWGDRLGALRMRLGIGRGNYRVQPGLYRIGSPDSSSPVLATANYKLTFDALRSKLGGVDAWILVLDTKGINVWCAAGKNTFSTTELSRSIIDANLYDVVDHRTIVVPQLGAPGVAAHEVRAFTEFRVVYGPVYAEDIRAFLEAGMKTTPEMRRVTFTTWERFVLTGVELSYAWKPQALGILALVVLLSALGIWGFSVEALLARGTVAAVAALTGLLSGGLVMPLLLPWLPSRMLAAKGALLGTLAAAALYWIAMPSVGALAAAGAAAAVVAIASYVAMNFTGTTPYTSPSGVEFEMRRWLPVQVALAAVAIVSWVVSAFLGRGW